MLPEPAKEPMVSLAALRPNVAPESIVTAVESARALAVPSCSVPAETVVVPVKVLLPVSVSVPAPCLAKVPAPEMMPA